MSLNFAAKGGKSTEAAKQALHDSIVTHNPSLAKQLLGEKNWRANYYKWMMVVNATMLRSPAICVHAATAGLHSLRTSFQLNQTPLAQVEKRLPCTPALATTTVHGKGPETEFTCPMNGTKHTLSSLAHEMQRLVERGAAEPSAHQAVQRLANNPQWLSKHDLSAYTFAILGAGSQMGPCKTLLNRGATVLAVDLKGREEMWDALSQYARQTPGTLVIPMSHNSPENIRGCDILSDFEAIARWIVKNSRGKRIVIGGFLYADGALFSRIAVAADAVIDAVCTLRSDTALISLCSPTEVFSVPKAANEEATQRYTALSIHTPWLRAVGLLSKQRYLEQNVPEQIHAEGTDDVFLLQDSQVWQQGPNYAFAKLIQRWRNIVSRDAGHWVSSNVAPASLTVSVMHNSLIRAGMLGCQFFGIVPFEPSTSNSLMTALALHDLKSKTSYANPNVVLKNPLNLFMDNAVHGGTWRCAYKTNSYTEVSAVLYGLQVALPYAVVGGVGGWMGWKKMVGGGRSKL